MLGYVAPAELAPVPAIARKEVYKSELRRMAQSSLALTDAEKRDRRAVYTKRVLYLLEEGVWAHGSTASHETAPTADDGKMFISYMLSEGNRKHGCKPSDLDAQDTKSTILAASSVWHAVRLMVRKYCRCIYTADLTDE